MDVVDDDDGVPIRAPRKRSVKILDDSGDSDESGMYADDAELEGEELDRPENLSGGGDRLDNSEVGRGPNSCRMPMSVCVAPALAAGTPRFALPAART